MILKRLSILFLTLFLFRMAYAANPEEMYLKLEASLSHEKAVIGQPVLYEVKLITSNPNVAGVQVVNEPDFSGLKAETVNGDSSFRRYGGQSKRTDLYEAVIDRKMLTADKSGNYKIPPIKYKIYNKVYNRQYDPFWGSFMGYDVEELELTTDNINLSVKELPVKGKPSDFSGAVGDYEIMIELPRGEIREGSEALVIIKIFGEGDLDNINVPGVMKGFVNGLKFHSMSENRNSYIKNGKIYSELILDCYFVPERDGEIFVNEIPFTYFSTDKNKFITIKTEKLPIEVKGKREQNKPKARMDI